jgi:uncharacterized OsmC-like protein
MNAICVTHLAGTRYCVTIGPHAMTVDQPQSAGGDNQGPTPLELFAASLIACTAHYAGSYLARRGIPTEGLVVKGDFTTATDSPARVVDMSVSLTPPPGLPAPRQAALLAVASHCTVHNTLRQPPTVSITLAGPPAAPSGERSRQECAA